MNAEINENIIKQNILKIKDNIENVKIKNGIKTNPKIVAATKYVNSVSIKYLVKNGVNIAGENKVQDFRNKYSELDDYNKNIDWHFIGHLQTNKVKYIIDKVSTIHSVNSIKLLSKINSLAERQNRIIKCLIEINTSEEDAKTGLTLDKIELFFDEFLKLELKNVKVTGLMTMAAFTKDEKIISKSFNSLLELKAKLNEQYKLNLTELSMGMSNDYHLAIKFGATLLRLGTILFI